MEIEEYENMQNVIESILAQQEIIFEVEKEFSRNRKANFYIPDLYLPYGGKIGNISMADKSCIELKLRLLPTTISSTYKRFQVLKERYQLGNLYLIYKEIPYDTHFCKQMPKGMHDLYLLRFEDLQGYLDTKNRTISKTWKELRDCDRIPQLVKSIKSNNATLFLGAGVSQSANLPSWKDLLRKIFQKCSFSNLFENDIDKILEACHHSTLITARYLTQKKLTKHFNLEDIIHDIFYIDSKPKYSQLMKSIVHFSTKEEVKSIITYNYDDLIDQRISNSRPMYGNRRISNAKEFPIYHVHGYVPEKNSLGDSEIILSEERYHEKYRQVFDWSNVEQIYALTHTTCLFIGMSMSDPNLRRLLDIAKVNYISDEQDCPHYAFLKRSYLNGCNMPCGKNKNDEHIYLMEQMFGDMGITVIWYENHDELPQILASIAAKI